MVKELVRCSSHSPGIAGGAKERNKEGRIWLHVGCLTIDSTGQENKTREGENWGKTEAEPVALVALPGEIQED